MSYSALKQFQDHRRLLEQPLESQAAIQKAKTSFLKGFSELVSDSIKAFRNFLLNFSTKRQPYSILRKTSELIQNTDLATRSQLKGLCHEMEIIFKDYKIQSVHFVCALMILNFLKYLTGVILNCELFAFLYDITLLRDLRSGDFEPKNTYMTPVVIIPEAA
jgi:hypothetical protein